MEQENIEEIKSPLNESKKVIENISLSWSTKKEEPKKEKQTFDIPDIILLLQGIGFLLTSYEEEDIPTNDEKKPNMKLELYCSQSGMKATMVRELDECRCPSSEDAGKAQFWNVSGCGPTHKDVNFNYSSLLPSISSFQKRIVADLMDRVLKTLKLKETFRSEENLNQSKIDQKNVSTVGVASPPQRTSSPISENGTDSSKNKLLEENLHKIKNLAEETLSLFITKNTTFTKSAIIKRRISDIPPLQNSKTGKFINLTVNTPSSTKNKSNFLTPKTLPSMMKSSLLRKDTPRPTSTQKYVKTTPGTSKLTPTPSTITPKIFKSKINSKIPAPAVRNKIQEKK